jgi:hypothetical protein
LFLDRGYNVLGKSRTITRKNELQVSKKLALVDGDIGLASTADRIVATAMKRFFTGRPARVLASRLTRELGPMADAAPDFPLPLGALLPLISEAERRGINDFTPLWSGEAAPLARELPAERLTTELATGALERFRQLSDGASSVPSMNLAQLLCI